MNSNHRPLKFGNLAAADQKNRLLGIKHVDTGKVRDVYTTEDGYLIMITSDDVSAFDVILPKKIPNKGIILNQMTIDAFESIGNKVPHWFITSPHPRVLIGKLANPIKAEVIVRGNLEGSAWRGYKNGKRDFWGITLPEGMREHEKLPKPIITPTTKAPIGQHDEDITSKQIVENGICSQEQWEKIEYYAKILFEIGTKAAARRGLILLDTKYEFGLDKDGEIILIDEVHTMDSSRFFTSKEYYAWRTQGTEPQPISKEFIRNFLKENGFMGEKGQVLPVISPEIMKSFQDKYYEGYALLTDRKMESDVEIGVLSDELKDAIMYGLRSLRTPQVGIVMGSDSDLPVMKAAADFLDKLCIGYELTIVSAHRTPDRLFDYAASARSRGLYAIIAGAGGAAHLPGMLAAKAPGVTVIGVPIKSSNSIDGWDSILSILQMPNGIPVATVALNAAKNAAILAVQILGVKYEELYNRVVEDRDDLEDEVYSKIENMDKTYPCEFVDSSLG